MGGSRLRGVAGIVAAALFLAAVAGGLALSLWRPAPGPASRQKATTGVAQPAAAPASGGGATTTTTTTMQPGTAGVPNQAQAAPTAAPPAQPRPGNTQGGCGATGTGKAQPMCAAP